MSPVTAADLRGLAPGLTGGLGSVEYVRQMRSEVERDPDPTIEDVPDTGEDDTEPEPTDDPIPADSQ